jgi:hypothetical protein
MKQTPEMDKYQERMKAGHLTLEGFLGPDKRKLVDILIEDDATVNRLGLTHEQIAKKMYELRDAGARGLGEFIRVEPNFEVKVESVRGKLPSPFDDGKIFQKINISIENTRLKKSLTFTELHIHMIEDHGFYEGKGHVYRLDPQQLAEILEIEPE